ncbi:hypothetical protein IVB45_23025 [Bradyrhizobium sp. 4]|uniref:hypothetical protein n=1 Tax=unclassified Bradyrhizobium TaxID=2631580 RepID=UPI001FFB28F1|nr:MULTISPECIES: hypothetical protein [unclassified Bradyrhizobium]MCK1402772.1 hypothetical protein [Bradyrhizobium sp. 39]MCK1748367.1 hypothetical protein [Bradyrhizobium sp. 135]UPJ32840.1 hypothetical protein IVB45_23025 [Bradyrhizobium sp. 4]
MSIDRNPSEAIVVMAHHDPAFEGSYHMRLTACGRLLAIGRDPLKASARRLIEDGVRDDTALVVRFEDGRAMLSANTLRKALNA